MILSRPKLLQIRDQVCLHFYVLYFLLPKLKNIRAKFKKTLMGFIVVCARNCQIYVFCRQIKINENIKKIVISK